MPGNDILASLVGAVDGSKRAADQAARDIDWVKVRRVQHRLNRPAEVRADPGREWLGDEGRWIVLAANKSRAMRLANLLALLGGVVLGLGCLEWCDVVLLSAGLSLTLAGGVTAYRAK